MSGLIAEVTLLTLCKFPDEATWMELGKQKMLFPIWSQRHIQNLPTVALESPPGIWALSQFWLQLFPVRISPGLLSPILVSGICPLATKHSWPPQSQGSPSRAGFFPSTWTVAWLSGPWFLVTVLWDASCLSGWITTTCPEFQRFSLPAEPALFQKRRVFTYPMHFQSALWIHSLPNSFLAQWS